MSEVGAGELERAAEREPALDHRDRHGQTDESEPGDGRQQTDEPEVGQDQDRRHERHDSDLRRPDDAARLRPDPCRERGRERVGDARRHRTGGERERQASEGGELGHDDAGDGRRDPERERAPEAAPVEADRFGDQLADRPGLGRERCWQRLRPAPLAFGSAVLVCHATNLPLPRRARHTSRVGPCPAQARREAVALLQPNCDNSRARR